MLQYKIPQNVGIEDRIVGPLTLRQLIILAIGAGVSYVLFLIAGKAYELNLVEYGVIALPALFSAAAALIRINDLSFSKFVLLTLEYNIKPKSRRWDHRAIAPWIGLELVETAKSTEPQAKAAEKGAGVNLSELSLILDSGGFKSATPAHPDIDQVEDQDLVTQAFFGQKQDPTGNMYWRAAKHDRGKRLKLLAELPATSVKKPIVATLPAAVTAPATPARALAPIKPAPLQAVAVPVVPKPVMPSSTPVAANPLKKRRRKKKNRNAGMARPDLAVNTIHKSQPVQFMPKPAPSSPPAPTPKKPAPPQASKSKEGEFEFKELEKGEIEINLN